MLKKEEYHDYFQKKMRIANPGKELTSQTFFNKFVMSQETQDITEDLKSDNFYFWTHVTESEKWEKFCFSLGILRVF